VNLNLAPIDIIIFIVYLLAVIGLGVYASTGKLKTRRDYFLAGDKLPWYMIGGSIVAANISSHHLVGVMGVAYDRGFVAVVIEWGAILIGFNALLWIFLPFYLRKGFYTVPEFLHHRFGTAVRTVYSVLILLTYILVEIGGVLYLGALALHTLLGTPVMTSAIVLALLTGIYTIAGGLKAVVWTEILQLAVLLFGGFALSFATIQHTGGWSAVWATSSEWKMFYPADDPDFPWTMYLGGMICISVFYNATNQFIVQRVMAAKNEWHARIGVIFSDYLKFLIPLIIVVPALVAPAIFPDLDQPDLLFPLLVETLLPAGLVGLVMAGLIAAMMSHLSGAINSSTTILTVDIYQSYLKKNATDRQAVRFGRISGAVIVVLGIITTAVFLQHSDKPVFLYILNAYGLFTPGIAAMFLMGIFWKGTTHAGALTAGLITIPLSIAMESWFPDMPFFNRTGIVFWVCMAVCGLVSLITKPKSEKELEGLIWTWDSLKLPPHERAISRGLRSPLLWWGIITGIVLFFYIRFA